MNEKKQTSFLGYLHSFRGFAIINIVFIHAFGYALYEFNNQSIDLKSPYSIGNELLFHNSTIYFAVISGILFSVVLKSKGYKRFYSNKFKNVLLPYLFLTLFFSIFKPVFDPPIFVPFAL
jgi:surface polysaccharide O-acyltransferase-like enzyme